MSGAYPEIQRKAGAITFKASLIHLIKGSYRNTTVTVFLKATHPWGIPFLSREKLAKPLFKKKDMFVQPRYV